MNNEHNYRLYEAGDEDQIIELLETVFPRWPSFNVDASPLEHWKWKYLDNPLLANGTVPHPVIIVCETKGQIIGVAHSIIFKVKIGATVFLGSHGPDFAVHQDHRGKGISRTARNLRFEYQKRFGIAINLGMTENPILIERNIRHGYPRFPHELATYVLIHDINEHMKHNPEDGSYKKKYGYLFFKKLNSLINIPTQEWTQRHDIIEYKRFDYRVNTLWDQVKDHHKFIIERKMDHLNWKYCDPRGGNFSVRIAEENGNILGFSVLALNDVHEDYKVGVIVDLISPVNDLEIASDLVFDATRFFEKKGINLIKMRLVKNHPFTKVLWKAEFVDTLRRPDARYIVLSEINKQIKMIRDSRPGEVHYVLGDLDTL